MSRMESESLNPIDPRAVEGGPMHPDNFSTFGQKLGHLKEVIQQNPSNQIRYKERRQEQSFEGSVLMKPRKRKFGLDLVGLDSLDAKKNVAQPHCSQTLNLIAPRPTEQLGSICPLPVRYGHMQFVTSPAYLRPALLYANRSSPLKPHHERHCQRPSPKDDKALTTSPHIYR